MSLNKYCLFTVVDSVIHCRNNFEARIQLFELELLVRPWGQPGSVTIVTACKTSTTQHIAYSCAHLDHTAVRSHGPAVRQYLRHFSGGLCRWFADTCQNWPKLWQSLGPGDAATYEVTSRFCHTCVVPLRRGAARVVCVAFTSRAFASLRPSPKSSGPLRRCLLMQHRRCRQISCAALLLTLLAAVCGPADMYHRKDRLERSTDCQAEILFPSQVLRLSKSCSKPRTF